MKKLGSLKQVILLGIYITVVNGTVIAAEKTRADQIVERFTSANQNRDHIMVVAHRGSWWKNGQILLAENSISSIDRAINLGVDMVEMDVQKTKNGHFVILHDLTLDRTTTCKGEIAEWKLGDLRNCKLVIEGTGAITKEVVPTIQDVFKAVKGRIMLNLDIKVENSSLIEIAKIADEMGVSNQILVKTRVNTKKELRALKQIVSTLNKYGIHFMPIMETDRMKGPDVFKHIVEELKPEAIETIVYTSNDDSMDERHDMFYGFFAQAAGIKHDIRMWINTLYYLEKPGYRSGGRGDEMAVAGGLPKEVWGYWADNGAAIFQTDEPEIAIEWLNENGYRVPYQQP